MFYGILNVAVVEQDFLKNNKITPTRICHYPKFYDRYVIVINIFGTVESSATTSSLKFSQFEKIQKLSNFDFQISRRTKQLQLSFSDHFGDIHKCNKMNIKLW